MIIKSAMLALTIMLGSSVGAFAAEPVPGVRHKFDATDHDWQLDQGNSLVLAIFEGESQTPLANYDLENCVFCAGEDDNCESDGIVEVNLAAGPEEPILAVACHIGVHSQRLQIFAPWRNRSDAVYSITGEFFVSYAITPEGVTIEYDARKDDGGFESLDGSWP